MSAVPPGAADAATRVFMLGGSVQDMLEAAAPLMLAGPRSLVAQWRRSADSLSSSDPAWSSHFHDCANELERLLANATPDASGGDGPGGPQDGPRTAEQGPAGVTGYREP